MPGGNYNSGSANNVGTNGNWWSATENNSNNAYNRNMNSGDSDVNRNNNNKTNGYSVRCVRDCKIEGGEQSLSSLFTELYRAYMDARKHKRNTINQLQFERNLESELLALANELETFSYEVRPSICFINEKPVKREIVAADFRDRVVQHLLFNRIYHIFDKKFIYDSYSCRVGKGTLFGIKRAAHFCSSEGVSAYSLRLDVSGYFMAINRDILYGLIMETERSFLRQKSIKTILDCHAIARNDVGGNASGCFASARNDGEGQPFNRIVPCKRSFPRHCERSVAECGNPERHFICDDFLTNYLLRKIVFSHPLANVKYKSPPNAWADLPKDKSLKYSATGCGLPIGNLTSQLFSNIYLNPLDHFIKRELKIKCYGRYVDDMLLIHGDKSVLLNAIEPIRDFLFEKLHLKLHPKKIKLQPLNKGFPFLGAFIKPDKSGKFKARAGKRIISNFKTCVLQGGKRARVQSYLGLLKSLR